MKEKFYRFMSGRNGSDELARFCSFTSLGIMILYLIVGRFSQWLATLLSTIAFAGIFYSWFRIFSRNISRRRLENEKYMRFMSRIKSKLALQKTKFSQRREYRFFTCVSCRAVLRVPKGKGRVKITCKKCGATFWGKT